MLEKILKRFDEDFPKFDSPYYENERLDIKAFLRSALEKLMDEDTERLIKIDQVHRKALKEAEIYKYNYVTDKLEEQENRHYKHLLSIEKAYKKQEERYEDRLRIQKGVIQNHIEQDKCLKLSEKEIEDIVVNIRLFNKLPLGEQITVGNELSECKVIAKAICQLQGNMKEDMTKWLDEGGGGRYGTR